MFGMKNRRPSNLPRDYGLYKIIFPSKFYIYIKSRPNFVCHQNEVVTKSKGNVLFFVKL